MNTHSPNLRIAQAAFVLVLAAAALPAQETIINGGSLAWEAAPAPPGGAWLDSPEVPGFRFKARIGGASGKLGREESDCLQEALCVSGAKAGRVEALLRVVGPKPNGYLWPTLVKFTPASVEVWVEQLDGAALRYYLLPAVPPWGDTLDGLFDRTGFLAGD